MLFGSLKELCVLVAVGMAFSLLAGLAAMLFCHYAFVFCLCPDPWRASHAIRAADVFFSFRLFEAR
jgi:hypothetical protein